MCNIHAIYVDMECPVLGDDCGIKYMCLNLTFKNIKVGMVVNTVPDCHHKLSKTMIRENSSTTLTLCKCFEEDRRVRTG